jgi:hypothetical protein
MTLDHVWQIDPALALRATGLIILALVPAGALWAALDTRRVGRERVAIKPTKFALSISVYLLTVSWMLGYARPDRMSSAPMQMSTWGLLVGATVELACIALQAARGRRSHFNTASRIDTAIAVMMAVLAILFTGMLLPLAWEIGQRPRANAPALMIAGIVGGLLLTFVLGGLTGSAMGKAAVRASGSGEPSSLAQRRYRMQIQVAHFLAIHAMQALPIMAWAALAMGGQTAVPLLTAGAICYSASTLLLLYRPALLSASPMTAAPFLSRS